MSEFFQFLKSKVFFINFGSLVLLLAMIFGFTYKWLDTYTDHGNTVTVPDLRGLTVKEVQSFLANKSLQFKIADSSAFDLKLKPGTVVEQDPAVSEKVKKNRTIYLTITGAIPPQIRMADLKDASYRQAEAILLSGGLKVGTLTYKSDLCNNCVLNFSLHGRILNPGDTVPKGSVIDLVLGDGLGNTQVIIPDLYNLPLDEALFILKGSGLMAGKLTFDGSVRDSSNARVYKQFPGSSGDTSNISQGEAIDLFLTENKSLLNNHE